MREADCIFCRIAAGEVHANIVLRDAHVTVFMDRGAIRPGHVQIVPNDHYPYFDDLPEHLAAHVMATGQRLARALKQWSGQERVAFLFTGGDVPHAHAHCLPMHQKTDITSTRYIAQGDLTFVAPDPVEDAQLADTAAAIRKVLAEART